LLLSSLNLFKEDKDVKKLLLGTMCLVLFYGCVPAATVLRSVDPVVVQLEIRGVDTVKVEEVGDKVVRSMEVENEAGAFSGLTFIENGVGYMKMWGTVSAVDANYLWNDLTLLQLRGIKAVELYINTGGGSAFDGLSITDQVERFVKKGGVINAHASGIIASATVPILAVCSKRFSSSGAIFMVHQASIFKYFSSETKSDLASQTSMMNLLETIYMSKLEKYTKLSRKEWTELSKDTTWFGVEDAIKFGLVDEVE
jgi:ATP-dependent protease ClpP protease subunit